jgi:hypothetical protein
MANGKWWIVDKKDTDVSGKEKKMSGILKKTNPLQSWTELIM